MKGNLKRVISVILTLLMLLTAIPLGGVAFAGEVFTASVVGTVVENRVFDDRVTVNGSFIEGNYPSVIFKNCSFKSGVDVIAGGDWDLFFENSDLIDCSVDVRCENNADLRPTNDFVYIEGVPNKAVINVGNARAMIRSKEAEGQLTVNGVQIVNADSGTLDAYIDFENYDGEYTNILRVNGAKSVDIGAAVSFNKYEFNVFNNQDIDVIVNCADSLANGRLELQANSVYDLGCNCPEEGECTCACCQNCDCGNCGGSCCNDCCFGYCDECRKTPPDGYVYGKLNVSGVLVNNDLILAGRIDISELAFNYGSGEDTKRIEAGTWNEHAEYTIGAQEVNIVGDGEYPVIVNAASNAIVNVDNCSKQSVLVNGELSVDGAHLFGDGNVFISGTNRDTEYSLWLDGQSVGFTPEYIDYANITNLNVTVPDDAANYYDISAKNNSVEVRTRAYHENVLVARSEGSFYDGITFDDDVRIVNAGGNYSRVQISNCTFMGDVKAIINDDYGDFCIDFSGDQNTIAGNFIATTVGQYRFAGRNNINVWNLPSDTTVRTDAPQLNLNGNLRNSRYTVNGVGVEMPDVELMDYTICVSCQCFAEHDWENFDGDHSNCDNENCVKEMNFFGDIEAVNVTDTCDIGSFIVDSVREDVTITIIKSTPCASDRLRFRVNQHDDYNIGSQRPYKENPVLFVKGVIKNNCVEIVGMVDISDLAFVASENNRIEIGSWGSNTDVNIGSNTVTITGGAEFTPKITALSGSRIEIENDRQNVNINNGEFFINSAHIFGDENNYSVFLETADADIEYKLFCNGEEKTVIKEIVASEGKTHLFVDEPENDLHDWRVEAVKDGITLSIRLAHKQQICEHEFTDWVDAIHPTCKSNGVRVRLCPFCDMVETELIPRYSEHKWSSEWTVDVQPTCVLDGEKSHHCIHCDEKSDVTGITKLGHSYGEWQKNNDGTHSRVCAVCDALTQGHTEKAACSYKTDTVRATCTLSGYNTHTCTVCADSYNDTYVAPLGHSYGKWQKNNDGTHSRVCTACDASTKGHTQKAVCSYKTVVSPATCTQAGYTMHTCTACSYSYKDATVKKLGHSDKNKDLLCDRCKSCIISGVKVTGLKASKTTSTSVQLTWNKLSGATGYRVYMYSAKYNKYVKVKDVTSNSLTVTKLSSDSTCYFRVKAYKKVATKTYWGADSATLKTYTAPGKVTGLAASTRTTNSIKLTWKKVDGADGYRIYRYDAKTKGYVLCGTAKTNNSTVKSLKASTAFKFYVVAYRTEAKVNYYGDKCSAISVSTR